LVDWRNLQCYADSVAGIKERAWKERKKDEKEVEGEEVSK